MTREDMFYRLLFNHVYSGIAIYKRTEDGKDFVIKGINKRAEKILHLKEAEIVDRRVTEVFPGVETFGIFHLFHEVYNTGQPQVMPLSQYQNTHLAIWVRNYIFKLPITGEIVAIFDDFTDTVDLQTQLIESEKKFRTIFYHSPIAMILYDKDEVILDCNDQLLQIIGAPRKEIVGLNLYDDPNYQGSRKRMALLNDGKEIVTSNHYSFDHVPYTTTKTDSLHLLTYSRRVENAIYSEPLYAAQIVDQTKQVHIEYALRESEERYRRLIENIPTVAWVSDEQGHTVYISPNVEQVYGYTAEEILSGGSELWFKRVHPDDLERLQQAYTALFAQFITFDLEYRIRHKDGHWIWLHDRANTIRGQPKQRLAYGIFSDITERRHIELRLEESERKYHDLYEHAPDMFVSVSAEDASILECNETLLESTGYRREEVIGHPIFKMYHPNSVPAAKKVFAQFVAQGEIHNAKMQLQRKDGSPIDVSLNVTAVRDEDGTILYSRSSWRDITEQIHQLDQINTLNRTLINVLEDVNRLNDSVTGHHIERVSQYSELFAQALGCSKSFCQALLIYASLHDVGKVGLPDHILKKPGKYTPEEFQEMTQHVRIGAEILTRNTFPQIAINIARYHHEDWIGTGYLDRLKGEEIPLEARIVAIMDTYDALSTTRPYKEAFPELEIDTLMLGLAGKRFDPRLIDVFFDIKPQILTIKKKFVKAGSTSIRTDEDSTS